MSNVDDVVDYVRSNFPEVEIAVDAPDSANGITWLDLRRNGGLIAIECRPEIGFGLYHGSDRDGIGFGPDEVHRDKELLLLRLRNLIPLIGQADSGMSEGDVESFHLVSERAPQFAKMSLRDVRELLDVTQAEIAEALGKQQSAISKIEQRGDMLLSTLVSVIHSLGGKLEIKAHFKNCELPIYTDGRPATIQSHPGIFNELEGNHR